MATKNPSDRVTIRLPAKQVRDMDSLIELGRYATRTEVIRDALRMFFEQQGAQALKTIEAERGMLQIQQLAADIQRLKRQTGLK
ncbi:MAG TPA: ribbon-helix-helix domain-containing protein [Candidatus Thermoplasmatota archaeon]|nr:ribbon-helix-helix domain-containing protein [Candidatus Thermoplasmatota archaeon]